jgi:hypothetical protein
VKRIVLVLALLSTPAAADQLSGSVSGTFGFYGDKCSETGQGKGCVMTFEITGEAAKNLYDRIKWKAQPDACTEGLVKDSRNGLRCFSIAGKYSCDFGYSFLLNRMTPSDVTC